MLTLKSTLLTERRLADNNQRRFYKHLKGTVGLGGRKARSEQFIIDEEGTLLRGKVRIRKRWGGFFQTLLNKSPNLDLTITSLFQQRPSPPSLGDEPTMDDMTGVIRGMPNWKAVGPDSLPAEVLKLDHPEFIRHFHGLLVNVWKRETSPSSGNMPPSKSSIKRRMILTATTTEGFRSLPAKAKNS